MRKFPVISMLIILSLLCGTSTPGGGCAVGVQGGCLGAGDG